MCLVLYHHPSVVHLHLSRMAYHRSMGTRSPSLFLHTHPSQDPIPLNKRYIRPHRQARSYQDHRNIPSRPLPIHIRVYYPMATIMTLPRRPNHRRYIRNRICMRLHTGSLTIIVEEAPAGRHSVSVASLHACSSQLEDARTGKFITSYLPRIYSFHCRDDCRFPHVLPDGTPIHPHHYAPRGGHRQRPSIHTNGHTGLEDRFAALTTQEPVNSVQPQPVVDGNQTQAGSASNGSSRSHSTEPNSRPRGSGFKPNGFANHHRPERRHMPPRPQRVPSADEFPVLNGSSTPPLRSPGSAASGWSGPTAAQVLKAPAPPKDESQPGTRGASPAPANGRPSQPAKVRSSSRFAAEITILTGTQEESKPEPNGTHAQPNGKMPVSFAAVAAPEAAKDVAVAA